MNTLTSMESTATDLKLKRHPLWTGYLLLFGCFVGLCALFSLVVTIGEALQEHIQSRWPQTAATIEHCSLERKSTDEEVYYFIDCRISYVVSDRIVTSNVRSNGLRAPERLIWEFKAGRAQQTLERMQEWVDAHPPGTLIDVHYNPSSYGKSAPVAAGMPNSGPRPQWIAEFTVGLAVIAIALLTIGTIARRLPVR